MASPVLGIDLGTTNSVVAYADAQRVRVLRDNAGRLLTASTVSFHPSGQILIGEAGRERRLVDAENTIFSIKRLIGRPYRSSEVRRAAERLPFKLEEGATGGVMVRARGELYSLPEISSFVLREVRALAEHALGQSCVNAVITVPANFNELQRMATRDAGRIAGLNVLRILNEPTAAALAYGYRANQNQRIAVYDLGGGTFDVSILELSGDVIEVIATAGDTYLGGDDIDRMIADQMVAQFLAKRFIDVSQDAQVYERVRMAAEWIKCQLSMLDNAEATVKEVAYGEGGAPLDLVFRFSRSDLDALIFPLISRTFDICEDALKLAGVRPTQLDGVILVGGQTRTPKVRDMVGEYFGMEPQSSVDPDLVVAQGAALQGFALAGLRSVEGSRALTKTLSGPPAPVRADNTLEYAKPAALARTTSDDGFEDEPTRVANRSDSPPNADAPLVKNSDAPFDELPTTVSTRANEADTVVGDAPRRTTSSKLSIPGPTSSSEPANPLKSTLMGVGSKAPPPLPASALSGLPKPPPLASVMQNARQAEPVQIKGPQAKTLAETPGAKQGARPTGVPPRPPSVVPGPIVFGEDRVPRAARLPSEVVGFDLVDEVTEKDLQAEVKAQGTPSLPPSAAAKVPVVLAPKAATMPETPKGKAAERVSQRPPAKQAEPASTPGPNSEPIRTHSMARLLATQGHKERALSIYEELIIKVPDSSDLRREAHALRQELAKSVPPTAAAAPVAVPIARITPSEPKKPVTMSVAPAAAPVVAKGPALIPSVNAPVSKAPSPAPATTPAPAPKVAVAMTPSAIPASGASTMTLNAQPSPLTAATQSQFPAPARANTQLLLDVTPHTLSVETAGGFCERIIERNAPIPTEQTRVFSTSQDKQVMVSMRVCQGEARRTEDNQVLGQVELLGLRPARRGEVSIAVTFIIDADGTLSVKAQDRTTGQVQAIRVSLVGALDPQELERIRSRKRVTGR